MPADLRTLTAEQKEAIATYPVKVAAKKAGVSIKTVRAYRRANRAK